MQWLNSNGHAHGDGRGSSGPNTVGIGSTTMLMPMVIDMIAQDYTLYALTIWRWPFPLIVRIGLMAMAVPMIAGVGASKAPGD